VNQFKLGIVGTLHRRCSIAIAFQLCLGVCH